MILKQMEDKLHKLGEQVIALESTVSEDLQSQVNDLEKTLSNDAFKNLIETLQNNIGTDNPQGKLHVTGDLHVGGKLIGAAQDTSGNALKIYSGQTPIGNTNWRPQSDKNGVYVDVDTSACGFESTPFYIVSTHGDSDIWKTTGGSSAYKKNSKGFRVYVKRSSNDKFSPAYANQHNWHVQWIAIGV